MTSMGINNSLDFPRLGPSSKSTTTTTTQEFYENSVTVVWGLKHNLTRDSRQFTHKMT